MSEKINEYFDDELAIQEAEPTTKQPSLYKVILVNDDFTPMEFVVHILELFFSIDRENATRIMLEVHTSGKGICGLFTREIAETKVSLVNDYSQESQHPLLCTMEKNHQLQHVALRYYPKQLRFLCPIYGVIEILVEV